MPPHMTRRHTLQAGALAMGSMALPGRGQAAASTSVDQAVRAVLATAGPAQAAALGRVVALADRGAIAALIQALFWMRPSDPGIDLALAQLAGVAHTGWFDWSVWQQEHPEIAPYPGYAALLADLLARVDPHFRRFVFAGMPHAIRLEEIVWGGVRVDGIPALDQPRLVAAAEATYLNDDDRVFGVEIGGDARAYPLRVADWHEMVNDTVGGVPVSLAYCTLCGAGILFAGRVAGRAAPFTFGSSGLLYRSNKLMYDRATDSLWNQFTGKPVTGALLGSGITLQVLPVALTSWSAWRGLHPGTRVLSLDTGFIRDYAPGKAYGHYFASKDLAFPAAVRDARLQKDLAFGIRLAGGVKAWPLGRFAQGALVQDQVGLLDVVLIGEASGGGVRAYEAQGRTFHRAGPNTLAAADGVWTITEAALNGPGGRNLPRLPGHVGYRFAWEGYFGAGVEDPGTAGVPAAN